MDNDTTADTDLLKPFTTETDEDVEAFLEDTRRGDR